MNQFFTGTQYLSFLSQLCATPLGKSGGLQTLLWVAAGFSVMVNLLLLAPSIYMLQVYDRVLTSRSMETLGMITLITLITLVAVAVVEYARSGLMAVVSDVFDQSMQERVWSISLTQAVGPDQSKSNQMLASQSLRDLSTIRAFLASPAIYALFDAPWVLIYAGVIYLMHPALGILALGSALVLLLLAALSDRSLRASMLEAIDSSTQQQRFQDSVHYSNDLVIGMHMTPQVVQHAKKLGEPAKSAQMNTQLGASRYAALTKFTRQSVQIAMLGLAAYVYLMDQATPGIMIAATVLLSRALAPAEQAIGAWRQFIETKLAWGRVSRLLLLQSQPTDYTQLPRPSGSLRFDNVSFAPKPGALPLLRNINFELRPGQCVVVVGPSGSGKSTLARMMTGLWQPSIGRIMLDGVDLAAWDPLQLAQFVGYMPQQTDLLEGSVALNIARFSNGSDEDIIAAAKLAQAHGLIGQLPQAFDTQVGKTSAYTLSGGQRQRIALARAVYGQPSLVILDEPNSSLDSEGEQALHQCIRELKKLKMTVLIVSQKINVFAVADRVLVMNQGKIDAFDTPAQLKANAQNQRAANPQQPPSISGGAS